MPQIRLPLPRLFSFALLLALPFALGGCNGPAQVTGQKVTLTYWGLFEKPEVMAPLIKKYQDLHPNVTIDYQPQSYTSLASYKELAATRLSQSLQSGSKETAPDIIRVHLSWLPSFSRWLAPIPSSVFSSSDFTQTFYPLASSQGTVNGALYGIPLMYDGLVLVYNPDLFAEAGIASPPSTWEDFRNVAIKLTKVNKAGQLVQAGAAIGLSSNVAFASDLLSLMWAQSNLTIPDDLGTGAAADALTFYTNFARQDHVWDNTLPYSINAFANGKVAMIFVPSWAFLDILGANPSVKMVVTPVPQVPSLNGTKNNVTWGSFWVESVAKSSPASATAWDFVKFLSEQSQEQQFFSAAAQIRPFGEAYSRRDLRQSLSSNNYLAPVLAGAETAASAITTDRSGNDEYVAAVTDAITAVNSGTAENTALTTCKQTLQQLIARTK